MMLSFTSIDDEIYLLQANYNHLNANSDSDQLAFHQSTETIT